MLQTLKIENVALIEKATLNFNDKLNVISGETGAGKSIMLDSLSFVFGGRADKTLIRTGANSMKVEAIFNCLTNQHVEFIRNNFNIDCEDELFISRELDLNGRNICKINGELVPVAVVKKICSLLADIHGQTDHLAILNNDEQLKIVDLFSKTAFDLIDDLNVEIDKLKEIENQIKALGGSESEKQNLIDLYSFQINEIESANIKADEFENLSNQKKEMQHFERINQGLTDCLSASEKCSFAPSAVEKLEEACHAIGGISSFGEHYQELFNRLNSVLIEMQDINATVKDDIENNIFDENLFNEIDNRLDYIKSLFRKYGGNYENLMQYFEETKNKLEMLIGGQEKYNELTAQKEKLLEIINKKQQILSETRKSSAKILKQRITDELRYLGMPNAEIDIEFSKIDEPYSRLGFDKVDFLFSSNIGFELKSLKQVVSGGEMSRVMLAYKIVVSEVDLIQTVVFDEIDTGLSGNIATVVAEYMARLSCKKQIIAVSHLPQICAMADLNVKVEKFSNNSTTFTKAVELKNDELLKEIARLMGAELDENGLKVSAELKNKCNNFKLKK